MKIKTRLIVLAVCVVLFFTITPYILLYALGNRIDFLNFKVTATGGIYVKALPQEVTIAINEKVVNKTGLFSDYIFQQNLLPGQHTVSITKEGYYGYQKSLPVQEKQVTKLEYVHLFKKNIPFTSIQKGVDNFYISQNGKNALITTTQNSLINFEMLNLVTLQTQDLTLPIPNQPIIKVTWSQDSTQVIIQTQNNYYLLQPLLPVPKITSLPALVGATHVTFNPQNSRELFYIKNGNLYSRLQALPVIKNITTYQVSDGLITYLLADGFLYTYDISNANIIKISEQVFSVKKAHNYNLKIISGNILLQENQHAFILDRDSKELKDFYNPVNEIKASPNGQKILLHNDHEIVYLFSNNLSQKIFLNRFSEKITDCQWLNDDYVIFNLGGNIVISEIDVQGNINSITLPQTVSLLNGSTLNTQNPRIYLNQQDKKMYVLTEKSLITSERLVP